MLNAVEALTVHMLYEQDLQGIPRCMIHTLVARVVVGKIGGVQMLLRDPECIRREVKGHLLTHIIREVEAGK